MESADDNDFASSLQLIVRAKDGDRASLGQLIERYRPRLLSRIRLMMGEPARKSADSDDFLQGVLLEIVSGFERFEVRDERYFLRWATAIARNNIRDHLRRKREAAFGALSQSGLVPEPHARDSTPSVGLGRLESHLRLAEAMESLPDSHREVLELRHFEGLGFTEIGARMERSANAVQLLHARAVAALGDVLAEE